MNKRRNLLFALGVLPFTGQSVFAQGKPPIVIAWLNTGSRESAGRLLVAFKEGVAALGWKEGSQVVIEERWADGRDDRLQPLAEELAARKPAIIVAASVRATIAAAKAAPNTAVVQANGSSLVTVGLAKSLAHPGGMVTGLLNLADDVLEKFVELLLAAAPKIKRIGFLIDSLGPNYENQLKAARRSAEHYRVDANFGEAGKAEELDAAISRLAKDGAQALVIVPSSLFGTESRRILKLALARRWPVIGNSLGYAEDGALMSYGAIVEANFRRAAYYVDRILKGAKPGDLPIEQPMNYLFVVNMKTAKALGLTIPPEIKVQATRLIE